MEAISRVFSSNAFICKLSQNDLRGRSWISWQLKSTQLSLGSGKMPIKMELKMVRRRNWRDETLPLRLSNHNELERMAKYRLRAFRWLKLYSCPRPHENISRSWPNSKALSSLTKLHRWFLFLEPSAVCQLSRNLLIVPPNWNIVHKKICIRQRRSSQLESNADSKLW